MSRFVTDGTNLSPHVTDDVTDVLKKNLGKTVFVTVSPIKTPGRGVRGGVTPWEPAVQTTPALLGGAGVFWDATHQFPISLYFAF